MSVEDRHHGREIGETGVLLQTDGDWQLEDHDNDDGPTIYHVPCNTYICDLNRKYPMCRGCGEDIPPSMISGFTLLNWNKAGDDEYFVQPGCEVLDMTYNGFLRLELRMLNIPSYPNSMEDHIEEMLNERKRLV